MAQKTGAALATPMRSIRAPQVPAQQSSLVGILQTAYGVSAAKPPLWSLPTTFFSGTAAAASIGLINSLGALGGFAGPYMIGSTNGTSGDFTRGLCLVGGTLIMSAATIVIMRLAVLHQASQLHQTRKAL